MSAPNEDVSNQKLNRTIESDPNSKRSKTTDNKLLNELLNGTFVALQMDSVGMEPSYISVSSYRDLLELDPSDEPQNFVESCVFQMLLEPSRNAPMGTSIKFGDVVLLIHRATSQIVTKRSAGGIKCDIHMEKHINEHAIASQFRLMPRFKLHVLVCFTS